MAPTQALKFINPNDKRRNSVRISTNNNGASLTLETADPWLYRKIEIHVPHNLSVGSSISVDYDDLKRAVGKAKAWPAFKVGLYSLEIDGAQVRLIVGDDFHPATPMTEDARTLDVTDLARVSVATDKERTSPTLAGIALYGQDKLTCAATDGKILIVSGPEAQVKQDCYAILPPLLFEAIQLMRADQVKVCKRNNLCTVSAPGIEVTGRLVDGVYPAFHGAIDPTRSGELLDNAQGVFDAIERASDGMKNKQHSAIVAGKGSARPLVDGNGGRTVEVHSSTLASKRVGLNAQYIKEVNKLKLKTWTLGRSLMSLSPTCCALVTPIALPE